MKPEQFKNIIRQNGRMQPWFIRNTNDLYENCVKNYYEKASSILPYQIPEQIVQQQRHENKGPVSRLKAQEQERIMEAASRKSRQRRVNAVPGGEGFGGGAGVGVGTVRPTDGNGLLLSVMEASRRRSLSISSTRRSSQEPTTYKIYGNRNMTSSSSSSCSSVNQCDEASNQSGNYPYRGYSGNSGNRSLSVPPHSAENRRRLVASMPKVCDLSRQQHQTNVRLAMLSSPSPTPSPLSTHAIRCRGAQSEESHTGHLMVVDDELKQRLSVKFNPPDDKSGRIPIKLNAEDGMPLPKLLMQCNQKKLVRKESREELRLRTLGDRIKQFECIQFADGPVPYQAFNRRAQYEAREAWRQHNHSSPAHMTPPQITVNSQCVHSGVCAPETNSGKDSACERIDPAWSALLQQRKAAKQRTQLEQPRREISSDCDSDSVFADIEEQRARVQSTTDILLPVPLPPLPPPPPPLPDPSMLSKNTSTSATRKASTARIARKNSESEHSLQTPQDFPAPSCPPIKRKLNNISANAVPPPVAVSVAAASTPASKSAWTSKPYTVRGTPTPKWTNTKFEISQSTKLEEEQLQHKFEKRLRLREQKKIKLMKGITAEAEAEPKTLPANKNSKTPFSDSAKRKVSKILQPMPTATMTATQAAIKATSTLAASKSGSKMLATRLKEVKMKQLDKNHVSRASHSLYCSSNNNNNNKNYAISGNSNKSGKLIGHSSSSNNNSGSGSGSGSGSNNTANQNKRLSVARSQQRPSAVDAKSAMTAKPTATTTTTSNMAPIRNIRQTLRSDLPVRQRTATTSPSKVSFKMQQIELKQKQQNQQLRRKQLQQQMQLQQKRRLHVDTANETVDVSTKKQQPKTKQQPQQQKQQQQQSDKCKQNLKRTQNFK